jgi:uncharacterized linocin/CFP29 family protein
MSTDFILNGVANGNTATQLLLNSGGDVNVLRPFIGKDGRSYINHMRPDGTPEAIVTNAGATLRDDEWKYIDDQVVKAFRTRLKLVNWFRSAGLARQLPGGVGRTLYQYERQSDISAARVNMDALAPGDSDRPVYDLVSLPMPIVSKEITMNWRQILESRNGNTPLDTSMMELAAAKVAEELERLHLGTFGTYVFGGATLYGLTNHPNRNTGSITALDGSWTPTKAYNDVLNMINTAYGDKKYGPFKLWYSTGYLPYMMQQFSLYDSTPLQTAISRIPQISSVEICDYLTGNQLLLVEENPASVQTIVGMDVTTVQWQEQGGLLEKFRVMAMMVPLVKLDIANNCGIVHFS